jgi:hypothetical protein
MTTTRTKVVASLALFAGVILTSGAVWAEATKIPLPEVTFTYAGAPGPETRIWTTDGQIQHIRRLPYELNGAGDDLTVAISGVCNHNRSLVTLDGNFWGSDHSVDVTWGELSGTFRGTHSGKTIDWVGYSTHVYHGVSGDFEGCKLMLDGVFDYATKSGALQGTLMVTGAAQPKAATASTNLKAASGGATKDTLPEVAFTYMGAPGPETRIWTTNGQIQHIRRLPYDLTGVGDDVTITVVGVCNHNRSLVTLDGNFWGSDQSVELTWGALTGTFEGSHSGKTIDWVGYSTHVYRGVSGDFEGCKLTLDGIFDYATKSGVFQGTIKYPPGE